MLGKKIKESRKEMGLTQLEFAKLVGTSRGTISDLERGINKAGNLKILDSISAVTNKDITYFINSDSNIKLQQYEILDSVIDMMIAKGLIKEDGKIKPEYAPMLLDVLEKEIAVKIERQVK